ncbi:TPA: recombinase RecA, partial [Escherichia coli]|nr:recombinase RecA [Escherichia coli]MED0042906.1 recombinase RecA [Escherichia coli]MED0489899.1 recombinase RecA [Escherichia coli]MED8906987.1 recombinase RecA [Escherichia coli]
MYLKSAPERGCAETVMAKNFVEEGKTVAIVASAAIS